jgi:hypothetical protein
MIQGLAMQHYEFQLIALAVSDFVFALNILINKNYFYNILVALFAFLYNLFFLVLDTLLIICYKKNY